MNELQKVERELLRVFVDACSRLGLPYYLVCGTALGAAKYEGFIPWDDDVDVGMPREAYETFLTRAPEILPQWAFLQTSETDPAYPLMFAKLRHSNTTYIETGLAHLPIHHGVYLDIFPLDGYPDDPAVQRRLEQRKRIYMLMLYTAVEYPRSPRYMAFARILRLLGVHKRSQWTVRRLNKLLGAWPIKDSALICNHGNWQGKREYAPAEQYGAGRLATFEGIQVRIPEKYDEYLTQKYGDWQAELPVEEQVGHHYYTVCDLERPYTYYTTEKRERGR